MPPSRWKKYSIFEIFALLSHRTKTADTGARDGHFSRLLTGYLEEVTALDL